MTVDMELDKGEEQQHLRKVASTRVVLDPGVVS